MYRIHLYATYVTKSQEEEISFMTTWSVSTALHINIWLIHMNVTCATMSWKAEEDLRTIWNRNTAVIEYLTYVTMNQQIETSLRDTWSQNTVATNINVICVKMSQHAGTSYKTM